MNKPKTPLIEKTINTLLRDENWEKAEIQPLTGVNSVFVSIPSFSFFLQRKEIISLQIVGYNPQNWKKSLLLITYNEIEREVFSPLDKQAFLHLYGRLQKAENYDQNSDGHAEIIRQIKNLQLLSDRYWKKTDTLRPSLLYRDIVYFDAPAENTIFHNNKAVKRLKINSYNGLSWNKVLLTLSYYDGEKCMLHATNVESLSQLHLTLVKHGYTNRVFVDTGLRKDLQWWEKNSVSDTYQPSETKHFHNLYKKSGASLATMLEKLKVNSEKNQIMLVSAGCGDGTDLACIAKNISSKNGQILKAGFDINAENIMIANLTDTSGLYFIGKLSDLDNHYNKLNQFASRSRAGKTPFVITLFSGTLCRGFCDGTYEAVQLVQIAYQHSDILITMGYRNALLNKRLAQAIGYNVIEIIPMPVESSREAIKNPILMMRRFTPEERANYLLKRAHRRERGDTVTCLDLSMSANPLNDLEILNTHKPGFLESITQLDLSWAKLDNENVEFSIEKIFEFLPALKILFTAQIEKWSNTFTDFIQKRKGDIKHYQRIDVPSCLRPYEVSLFSVREQRKYGLYRSMPVEQTSITPYRS